MRATICVVLVPLALAACSHPSSDTYDAGSVGRTIETAKASVVTSRVVEVTGETNLVGPGAGGVAAAATTGALKGSGALQVLAGLIGAGAGYAIQKTASSREGIEYVLKMDDGRTVTLVQNREEEEEPLPNGAPVLVQLNGGYTRIIADPTIDDTSPTEAWIDPDKPEISGNPEERGPLDLSVVGQPDSDASQRVDQQ